MKTLFWGVLCASLLWPWPWPVYAQFYLPQTQRYRLVVSSELSRQRLGKRQQLKTYSQFDYANLREGNRVKLILNQFTNNYQLDDTRRTFFMNRRRFVRNKTVVPYADASDMVRKLLSDSFDTPLSIFTLDSEGRTLTTKKVARSGAQEFMNKGIVELWQFFHHRYPRHLTSWQEEKALPVLLNAYAKGRIYYRKQGQGHLVTLQLWGKLTNARQALGPNLHVLAVVYDVRGKQQYNTMQHRWENGTVDIKMSYDLVSKGVKVQHTGKMVLKHIKR